MVGGGFTQSKRLSSMCRVVSLVKIIITYNNVLLTSRYYRNIAANGVSRRWKLKRPECKTKNVRESRGSVIKNKLCRTKRTRKRRNGRVKMTGRFISTHFDGDPVLRDKTPDAYTAYAWRRTQRTTARARRLYCRHDENELNDK